MFASRLLKVMATAGALLAGSGLAVAEIPSGRWNVGHFSAQAWSSSQVDVMFMEDVTERTGGAIKSRFHWSGAMGSGTELLELTAAGAVDIGTLVPSYFPGQMPLLALPSSLPLTWDDPVLAREVMRYLVDNNQYVRDELQRNNVWPLLYHVLPAYRLQCTVPVRRLEDLKGLRIRTFGEWPPQMFQHLGAIPVNIAMTEVYEGLQRSSLDCAYLSIEGAAAFKISEVARYWSDINLGSFGGYPLFVAKNRYDGWSDEFRKILSEAAEKAENFEKSRYQELEDETKVAMKSQGVEIVSFEDQERLREVTPNFLEKWVEVMCGRNMCAEAESVAADVKKVMEGWE